MWEDPCDVQQIPSPKVEHTVMFDNMQEISIKKSISEHPIGGLPGYGNKVR